MIPLADGNIYVGRAEIRNRQIKARRNYADDGVVLAIESHDFVENVFSRAEFASPQTRTDESYWIRSDFILARAEISADYWLHAENPEEVRGD